MSTLENIKNLDIDFNKLIGRQVKPLYNEPSAHCKGIAKIKEVGYADKKDNLNLYYFYTNDRGRPIAPWSREKQCEFNVDYTIDYCLTNNIVINAETEKEDEYVRTILHNAGRTVCNDVSYLMEENWHVYKEATVYYIEKRTWGSKEHATKNYNYTMIPAVWFIIDNCNLLTMKKEERKDYKVSRDFIGKVCNEVCYSWYDKILKHFNLQNDVFTQEFTIDVNTLRNWVGIAESDCPAAYNLLIKQYPEFHSNEINLRKPTTFERLSLFEEEEDSNSTLIAVRNIGDLANKSFYLNCNYNWELKTDNKDLLCLIPTKK